MTKDILKGVLAVIILMLVPTVVHAADLNIVCNDGQKPTISLNTAPLFQLSAFKPGDSISKTVQVTNKDPNNSCIVSLQGSGTSTDLSDRIAFNVDNIYTKTLTDFIKGDNVQIANLAPNANIERTITLLFDSEADNTLANQNLSFDIKVNSQWGNDQQGEVQGENTQSNTESNETNNNQNNNGQSNSQQEEVLGTETENNNGGSCTLIQSLWWIPLIIELVLTVYVIFSSRWYLGNSFVKLIITIALAVIAFFVAKAIGCNCTSPNICKYSWLLNILLGLGPIPVVVHKLLVKK